MAEFAQKFPKIAKAAVRVRALAKRFVEQVGMRSGIDVRFIRRNDEASRVANLNRGLMVIKGDGEDVSFRSENKRDIIAGLPVKEPKRLDPESPELESERARLQEKRPPAVSSAGIGWLIKEPATKAKRQDEARSIGHLFDDQ